MVRLVSDSSTVCFAILHETRYHKYPFTVNDILSAHVIIFVHKVKVLFEILHQFVLPFSTMLDII